MQIHTLLVTANQLDSLSEGAILMFDRDVGLLDQDDGLVARMADGTERLLIIEQALLQSWIATSTAGVVAERLRLEQVDALRLRITAVIGKA